MNETGGRSVLPFDGMIAADAWLWAKYRDDAALMDRLAEITQRSSTPAAGSTARSATARDQELPRSIKDVKIGPALLHQGGQQAQEPHHQLQPRQSPRRSARAWSWSTASWARAATCFSAARPCGSCWATTARLKYGARLIHSFLGDNSTVSCCELLNNLIFPAHEQHHNNSFLIASLVMGQSNVAAGADDRLQPQQPRQRRRDPGRARLLAGAVRHAQAQLPLRLVHAAGQGRLPGRAGRPAAVRPGQPRRPRDRLLVMPAYWWLYNMYALARNTWKFRARDPDETESPALSSSTTSPPTRPRRC